MYPIWQIFEYQQLKYIIYYPKRYTQAGLISIESMKGMYSLIPGMIRDPLLLGPAVHKYAYISTETVLFREGIINQSQNQATIISSISKKFSIAVKNL